MTTVVCWGTCELIVFLLIRQHLSYIALLLLLDDTVEQLQHAILLRRKPHIVITVYI